MGEHDEYVSDAPPPPPRASLFDDLPAYGDGREVIHVFECEGCELPSPYTHTYHLLWFVFPFVFHSLREDEHAKCPRCMRSHIRWRILPATLLANLGCPVILLWWSVVYVRTYFSRPF